MIGYVSFAMGCVCGCGGGGGCECEWCGWWFDVGVFLVSVFNFSAIDL